MSVTEAPARPAKMYEGMFLVDSAKFASDPEGTVDQIMKVLDRAEAEVVAHRPWADGKLAYEIEGIRKGLHYIVCFRMQGAKAGILNRQVQLSDTILRHLLIAHPQSIFDATVAALTGEAAGEEGEAEEAPAEAGE